MLCQTSKPNLIMFDHFQFGLDGNLSLYKEHIEPLAYTCALVLPLAYIIGLIFTLKTHKSMIHDSFLAQVDVGKWKYFLYVYF